LSELVYAFGVLKHPLQTESLEYRVKLDRWSIRFEVANFKGGALGGDTPHFYVNALVNLRIEKDGLGSISGICPCDYGYDARVDTVGEPSIM